MNEMRQNNNYSLVLFIEMNRIMNIDLNRLEISENEIKNVIGKVNKEMKLDGWILMELKNVYIDMIVLNGICK